MSHSPTWIQEMLAHLKITTIISITSLCSAIADSSCLTWCECVWTQKADNFNRFFQPTSGDLLFQILPTWGNVLCNFQPTGNIWKEADAWQVPSSHLKSKKNAKGTTVHRLWVLKLNRELVWKLIFKFWRKLQISPKPQTPTSKKLPKFGFEISPKLKLQKIGQTSDSKYHEASSLASTGTWIRQENDRSDLGQKREIKYFRQRWFQISEAEYEMWRNVRNWKNYHLDYNSIQGLRTDFFQDIYWNFGGILHDIDKSDMVQNFQ